MSLKEKLLSTSRLNKKIIVLLCDYASITVAIYSAVLISEVDVGSIAKREFMSLVWTSLLTVSTFWYFGVYDSVVRYLNLFVIYILAKALSILVLLSIFSKVIDVYVLNYFISSRQDSIITFEGWLVGFITFSFLILSSRLIAQYYFSERKFEKRVIIYGAGAAGIQLAEALRVSKEMQPIAFVDNNISLHNTYIGHLKVLNPMVIERFVQKRRVDEVLIAMPSASKNTLRNLLTEIEKFSVKVRILPGFAELAQGKISVAELKEVDISDLLERHEVEANKELISRNIEKKVVLITGAGGSIGSEISRQVAKNNPKKIILLDSSEYALYSIKSELDNLVTNNITFSVLANVTNRERMIEIYKAFKVNTVYHAAAYKHVTLVEENPFEAVTNNILGTKISAECAIDANVETFVLVSTDKAVRPTNIMGATKRFAELILQALSDQEKTRMTMVRFGNVIGSSGSAIPLFQQQIKNGGPVTVTHPDVIRYFMTIPEAAELVIQAGAMGNGGDVFVLDMGEPVKIVQLAKRLISLSGMEVRDEKNPRGDIEIIFTGLKPGEKLFEELLIGDNPISTEHNRILKAQEEALSLNILEKYLVSLNKAESTGDILALKDVLKEVVTGFNADEEIVDVLYLQKH